MSETIKTITRLDGKRRITVFRREDDLYFWREDRLSEWDDVPPSWLDGYPPSGLFESADEAEAEARSSVHWLRQF